MSIRMFGTLIIGVWLTAGAQAAVFAVSDADSEALVQALSEAGLNDEPNIIELAPDSVYSVNGILRLSGRLIINGNGAEITGRSGRSVGFGVAANADVTVEDLHFRALDASNLASVFDNQGTLKLIRSSLTDSYANYCGRAVCQSGYIISNSDSGTLILDNATVANNAVTGIHNTGTLTLRNVTVANNAAGLISTGPVTVVNSIIADNSNGHGDCNVETLVSLGHNISRGGNCGFDQPTDQQNIDPRLGALGNYGGSVPVIALKPHSPAIDAANMADCPLVDGRGYVRADRPLWKCDIGAFEHDGKASEIGAEDTNTWFDPMEDGHFFSVQVLEVERNQVLVHWNTFDADGNPLWLQGLGNIQGNRTAMVLYMYGGMKYPTFDPAEQTYAAWGTLSLYFQNCSRADATYEPLAGGLDAADSQLIRLARTAGLTCEN